MIIKLLHEALGLLLVSSLRAPYAAAGPSINVALQASFPAPPYLLELLLVTFTHPVCFSARLLT